ARKRWISNSVLPEPAGAWTRNERVTSSARSRALVSAAARAALGAAALRSSILLTTGSLRAARANPTQWLQAAVLAGCSNVSRGDWRMAGGNLYRQRAKCVTPALLDGRPIGERSAFHLRWLRQPWPCAGV